TNHVEAITDSQGTEWHASDGDISDKCIGVFRPVSSYPVFSDGTAWKLEGGFVECPLSGWVRAAERERPACLRVGFRDELETEKKSGSPHALFTNTNPAHVTRSPRWTALLDGTVRGVDEVGNSHGGIVATLFRYRISFGCQLQS